MHCAKPKDDVMSFLIRHSRRIKESLALTSDNYKISKLLDAENVLDVLIGERVLEVEGRTRVIADNCPCCGQIILEEEEGD